MVPNVSHAISVENITFFEMIKYFFLFTTNGKVEEAKAKQKKYEYIYSLIWF
jgi:hypothetical protein